MEHIFIACAAGDQPLARTLAANLEARGFRVVLDGVQETHQRKISPQLREARCTIVVWSPKAEGSLSLRQAADAASRCNISVPVRSADYPADKIPEQYNRVRPDVIPDAASKQSLMLEDTETLARVMSHLWRVPTPTPGMSEGTHLEGQGGSAKGDWIWLFLPPVAFLAFCLLVAVVVDTGLKHYNPYSGVRALNESAAYVTARRRHAQKLEWIVPAGDRIALAPQPTPPLKPGQEITILVHGYNVASRAIATYFDDAIAHLRAGGRGERSFIVFDWPAGARAPEVLGPFWHLWSLFDPFLVDTVATEVEMYNVGQQNARGRSSEAFGALVDFVNDGTGRKVNIIAHSMGCYLVLEALKKRSELSSKIDKLVLLAPAVHHDALEHPDIAAALANIDKVHVFRSNNDSVLSVYASLRHAAPMLGAVGPKTSLSLAQSIRIYDVTPRLGNKDVHGRYLRREGLTEISLAKALSE